MPACWWPGSSSWASAPSSPPPPRLKPATRTRAYFTLVGIGRIVSTYHVFATTADEPAHISCGLQYVAQHVYRLETQHPPLTRAFIALLPYLFGTRPRGIPNFQNDGWAIIDRKSVV